DRAPRDTEPFLREVENIVPQASFAVTLHLRKVEVGTAATFYQFVRIVEEVESEIEKTCGHGFVAHQNMLFGKVPSARPDHQGRQLVAQLVLFAFRALERQRLSHSFFEAQLSLDQV